MRDHVGRLRGFVGVAILAFALTSAHALIAQRLPIRTYSTSDGLAHNRVHRIDNDSRGFLWFCTAGGLSRFDGYSFVNFSTEQGLPSPSVNALLETRAGAYWVATDGGLVHFDPTDAHRMFTTLLPDDADPRARFTTSLMETRDGTVWVGTYKGVYVIDVAGPQPTLRAIDVGLPTGYAEQRQIAQVFQDSAGTIWIASPSGLYRRGLDGRTDRFTHLDGLPSDWISSLFEDHAGRLWGTSSLGGFFRIVASAAHGASVIDRSVNYSGPEQHYGLKTSWVPQVLEASDGRFWVATGAGLGQYFAGELPSSNIRIYGERNGLSDHEITSMVEDSAGSVWLGTDTAGAMRLTRGGLSTFGADEGIVYVAAIFEDRTGTLCFKGGVLGNAVTSVFEGATLNLLDRGGSVTYTRFGVQTARGFDWFKPAAVTPIGWMNSWAQEDVTLQASDGEWWVGTSEGLYRFPASDHLESIRTARPKSIYTTKDGLAGSQVYRLFEDSRHNIWVASTSAATRGLALWDRATEKLRDFANSSGVPSLVDNLPRAIGEDRAGDIWIAFRHGVSRFQDGRFVFFPESDALAGSINTILRDHKGQLWFGSETDGLVRVEHETDASPAFVRITVADGLSSNDARAFTEAADGSFYIGGGHGLDRFDPATGHVRHFTEADGLRPGIFRAAFTDRHGVVWLGASNGLVRVAADAVAGAPMVLITAVRIGSDAQSVSAVGEREMTLATLAPGQNQLQISFVGLGVGSTEPLRYQYRLESADARWSDPSDTRTVTFANLSPGRYRFAVRAINAAGLVSAQTASVAFVVPRPMWQRWWFVTLIVLAIACATYILYRRRLARALQLANMRTRIATDLHDDIGANLMRIAMLSDVARQTSTDVRASGTDGPLASIANIARESVGSLSDIVWAINPARESVLSLVRRMRQHANEVFTLRDVQLQFDAPASTDALKLGVDVRRDLLLIFKEAVNNAARHSNCSRVRIDLRVDRSRIELTVADDGVGFDTSRQFDGQGLANLTRRARRLNGTLTITSAPGAGTTVLLSVPI